ncbi:PAS domain S-box protein, partial [Tumidithrix elongata RA019]|nr:PAS domain S-box protein [Tumidithrix elongata RA019]
MNAGQSSKPKSSQIGKKKHQVFSRNLLAGLAIAVVSIVGGGWVAFQWFGEKITQNTQENLLAIADLKANQIERWVYERKGDARILAGRPSLADVLRAIETGRKDETTIRQWQVMQQAVRNTQREYNYKRIILLNRFGRAVWYSERDAEISAEVLATFKKIQDKIVTENAELVDLHWHDTKTGKAINYGVIAPIYDNLNLYDPFLGAVYLEADPAEYLFPLIQRWPTSSTSTETLLVRQEGNLIRYLNPLQHQENTALVLTRTSADPNLLAAKAIRATEPLLKSVDYRGVPVIGAARFVKGTPWIMISKIDIAEADSPLHQLIFAISGFMVLLIMISGVIFRQLWRSSKLSLLTLEQQLALESAIEIEQNASRYVTAIETSIDGFALLDRHGRFLEVNTSLSSLTGYSRDELLNLSIFDLAVMETSNPDSFMTDLIAKVCDRFNQQWKPKNRDLLDVEIGITYLSQGEGQFFAFVRDITNALKLQRQLERSNLLHTFLSHANEAIVRTRDSQELLELLGNKNKLWTGFSSS